MSALCLFVARLIAYDPRTLTTEGIFLGPVLAPRGGPKILFPLYFIRKLILLLFMEGYETDVGLREEGSKGGGVSRVPSQPRTLSAAYQIKILTWVGVYFHLGSFWKSKVHGKISRLVVAERAILRVVWSSKKIWVISHPFKRISLILQNFNKQICISVIIFVNFIKIKHP